MLSTLTYIHPSVCGIFCKKISTCLNLILQSFSNCIYSIMPYCSIYVTCDRLFLKFEVRVQIYMAALNIGCRIRIPVGMSFVFWVGKYKVFSCMVTLFYS